MKNDLIPFARWQIVEVTFAAVTTDTVVPHTLDPRQPGDVRFEVLDLSVAGIVYRGVKAAATDYIVLRTNVLGTYRIRLFIEAN